MNAKTIAIANPKSGATKFTSTFNLWSELPRRGKRILIVDGLFLALTNGTIFCRETRQEIHDAYGANLRIFKAEIPRAIKGAEISAMGKSIFRHNLSGEVAAAYEMLTKEVLSLERSKKQNGPETVR